MIVTFFLAWEKTPGIFWEKFFENVQKCTYSHRDKINGNTDYNRAFIK